MPPAPREDLERLLDGVDEPLRKRLRVAAQEWVNDETREARQSEDRLRRYFELSLVGMAITSPRKGWLEVNDKLCEILHLPREELVQKDWAELTHPDDLPADVAEFEKVLSGAQDGYAMDKRYLLANGEIVHASIDVRCLRDDRGEVDVFVALVHDITDRIAAEEENRRLHAKMLETQKLEGLGLLAGGVAHDFNNLLVGVLGHVSLALKELPENSPIRSHLDGVETSTRRAAELCNQMLAYSGRGRFVVEPIDLRLLVREMVQLLAAGIPKTVQLRVELPDELPAVVADTTQMRQVIMNLITNAADALIGENGAITVTAESVECDVETLAVLGADDSVRAGAFVALTVKDDGCGMSDDTLERIFDPFFSTKFTGRGLGLAAVQGIVRGHGGLITVQSELGEGSTFRLLLPADLKATAKVASEVSDDQLLEVDGQILFVDDEAEVRNVGCQMLERSGLSVLPAGSGQEALDLFEQHGDEIACAVIDLTMPDMLGTEVGQRLHERRPRFPIVLSSGFDEQEAGSLIVELGAVFLRKPYSLPDLLRALRRALHS